jgi:hypothetical protein
MKALAWAGILFIVLGALALVYHGFSYHQRKHVFDMGSVHVTNRTEKHVDVPPVVGGLVILGGIILVVAGSRGKA